MKRLATQHGAPAAHGARARERAHAQDGPHERGVEHRAATLDIGRELLKDHVATLELLELRLALALAPVDRLVVKAQTLLHAGALGFEPVYLFVERLHPRAQVVGHLTNVERRGQAVDLVELQPQVAQHADETHKRNLRRRIEAVALFVDHGGLKQADLVVIDERLARNVKQARHLADRIHTRLHRSSRHTKARRSQGQRAQTLLVSYPKYAYDQRL